MRKHIWSTVAILAMICLAFGSSDTSTSTSQPGGNASRQTSAAGQSQGSQASASGGTESGASDSEVERIFSQRQSEYERQLAAWTRSDEARVAAEAERDEVQSEIDKLALEKPAPPSFPERVWTTSDGKHKTKAVLVTADKTTVKLRKPDGTDVSIPKARLDDAGQAYVNDALIDLTAYRHTLMGWQGRQQKLTDKLSAAESRVTSTTHPKPKQPSREQVVEEVAAAEADRKARQQAAKAEAERQAAELAAQRAEEEYEQNGLVLLRKTVSGSVGEFGGKITGIVVNRRSRKLSYAQISFNLYDASGAQVGSALDNINGLEPGGRWKFEASSFGTKFSKYKINELSGF